MQPIIYTCAQCGATATRDEAGEVVRTCEHADAAIAASVSAVVYGQGSVQ